MNLEQKKVSIKIKPNRFNRVRVVVSVPLNDKYSPNIFLDIQFDLKNDHVLIGKCVHHNEVENFGTFEIREPKISVELDLDLFDVKLLSKTSV